MALASTYRPPLTTRQLLVSVQDALEAEVAFQTRVGWVDLKDPRAGSLGQPASETCGSFISVAEQYAHTPISLALGEFHQVDWHTAEAWLDRFAVGKIGLAGLSVIDEQIKDKLSIFRGKIVPALYADWQRAKAPEPTAIVELARRINAPYLLVDTYTKDGLGLFHWMSLPELQGLQAAAREFGAGLVVAGSLRTSDWPILEQLGPVTVGIRGAACETSADRTSKLSQSRIVQWLKWCER